MWCGKFTFLLVCCWIPLNYTYLPLTQGDKQELFVIWRKVWAEKKKGWAFILKFKMLNICARNRHMILMTDGLKNNNREKNTSCLLMSLVPPLFSLCDCYIHPHYTGKANSGIQPPLHANTEEPEKPETWVNFCLKAMRASPGNTLPVQQCAHSQFINEQWNLVFHPDGGWNYCPGDKVPGL